jgi:L-fuculose-phosphate aldolase
MTENKIRELIITSGKRLVSSNLVQGTWGNISVRVDERTMLLTPSGLDYNRLQPEDLVLMDIFTMEYKGHRKPSSEKDLHAGILRTRKDINAVIHSHPSYCCSVASARIEVPVMSPEMQSLVGGSIKIAKYSLPSTKSLGEGAVRAMQDRNGCVMANHGVAACGADIDKAFEVISIMEESCRKFIEDSVKAKAQKEQFSEQDMFDLFKAIYN